jgi:hypothetical protein
MLARLFIDFSEHWLRLVSLGGEASTDTILRELGMGLA